MKTGDWTVGIDVGYLSRRSGPQSLAVRTRHQFLAADSEEALLRLQSGEITVLSTA